MLVSESLLLCIALDTHHTTTYSRDRPGEPDRTVPIRGTNLQQPCPPTTAYQDVQQLGRLWLQVEQFPAVLLFLGIMALPGFVQFSQKSLQRSVFHVYFSPFPSSCSIPQSSMLADVCRGRVGIHL